MAKGLKYLLSILLLILSCGIITLPDGYVFLWGEFYQINITTELNLTQNKLTGSIPSEVGNLTNLEYLSLGDNQLTGEIPPEIENLTKLTSLDLSRNGLTGEIPSEIGNLTSLTSLTGLDLRHNQLTGEIPPEVCDMIERYNLRLDYILTGNNLTNTCK